MRKKSKFAADFGGFLWEKSQNSRNNWLILQDFSGKKSAVAIWPAIWPANFTKSKDSS